MAASKKFTDEEFIAAADKSGSMAELTQNLGVVSSGNGIKYMRKRLERLEYPNPERFYRGKKASRKSKNAIPLDKILVEDSSYRNNQRIKRLLIAAGLKEDKCEMPGCLVVNEWLAKPLVLQVDHINGKPSDNRLENIRLLCPNCHSQTGTFCRGDIDTTFKTNTKENENV